MNAKDRQKLTDAMRKWVSTVERRTDVEAVAKAARGNESKALRELLDLFEELAGTPQDPAPAKPLRNCDVGDAAEQDARFARFCDAREVCTGCPVKEKWPKNAKSCGVIWGQMPYEAPEGGEVEKEGATNA